MRFQNLNISPIPLIDGETPSSEFKEVEPIIKGYLNCVKCGKPSTLGVKNMETGEWIPLDKCRDCFIYGKYVPLTEQISLNENS